MTRINTLPTPRHVTTINDLTNSEMEAVFSLADKYLEELGDPNVPYRLNRSHPEPADFILASLFYEPSTRTRLSFEAAALRLGGGTITSADPAMSSAAKGESLADTVRVVGTYANAIVIRHPKDGAARLAAEYSPVPIINGGDGSHEHPTQTLCDMFTLRKRNRTLKKLNVAIAGDLKGSRTIHSFVYALARFGANISMMPAKGMELPAHVAARLREEFNCSPTESGDADASNIEWITDALYVTGDESPRAKQGKKPIDVIYVTRFQKERWSEKDHGYLTVNAEFLRNPRYARASVLHPLPRVGELDRDLDSDSRAAYFHQAAYGVPVRMALISLLLQLSPEFSLESDGGISGNLPLYVQPRGTGLACSNPNCIVHDEIDGKFTENKFYIVKPSDLTPTKLRCRYCETDIETFVVANIETSRFIGDPNALSPQDSLQRTLIAFADEGTAVASGFTIVSSEVDGTDQRRGFA